MQINLKTSFGIDDTLHVPRVFVIYILCVRFYGGGQHNTNNNKNNNEPKNTAVVLLLLLLMSHAEWYGNFCIFDDELECECEFVRFGSLKCLRVVPGFNKSWNEGTCDACASIKISQAINAVLNDNGH